MGQHDEQGPNDRRKDALDEVRRNASDLWGRLWLGEKNEGGGQHREGMTTGRYIAIVVFGLVAFATFMYALSYECDAECMDAKAERTAVAELEQSRMGCKNDFWRWPQVERTIKDATRFPSTFEWEGSFLGQVQYSYLCASDARPYHTYWTQVSLSNQFGVPEIHTVRVHLYPNEGLYEIQAFGDVIGIGLVED